MTTTMSGYPVIDTYGDPALVPNPAIPGTSGQVRALGGLRAGSVATCLLYVGARWHAEVERLVQDLGCWGYEFRTIRQGTAMSDHSAGAAIDLNAVRHPQGTGGTLSPSQYNAVGSIEAAVRSALTWGGRFRGNSVDEMHWQVSDGAAGAPVDRLAGMIHRGELPNVPAELRSGPAPTPVGPVPVGNHPAYPFTRGDGRYYGPLSGPAQSISGQGPNDGPYRAGLASWQAQVARQGYQVGAADGLYGPRTAAAARALQTRAHITVDGLIGWDTWAAAWEPKDHA